MGRRERKLQRLSGERKNIPLHHTQPTRPQEQAVPKEQREGVFVHSFICNHCGLHFNVYSWRANHHQTENIWCPECGQKDGHFGHYRARISEITGAMMRTKEGAEAFLNHPGEIFRHCPHPGASMMDDSTTVGLKLAE